MALWGNKDLVGNAGTIGIAYTNGLVTGTATTFTTVGYEVSPGDVIVIGAGATYGYAAVKSVSSDTEMTIDFSTLVNPSVDVPTGTTYVVTQEPVYTLGDSKYDAPEYKTSGFSTSPVFTGVFGVDSVEVSVANAATGDARKYAPSHSGWVGVTTYVDMHGNLRVKSEVLVAGGISNDNIEDNLEYPNV